jgi:FKBP-type peptidyl-prolyl cis-trans isomerase FkpA
MAQPATVTTTVTTSSGLVFQSLKEGTGASPAATDVVQVHYRGTFP